MDWKQKAFEALAEKNEKKAKKLAIQDGKNRVESAEKLSTTLQEFFVQSVRFTIDHNSDNEAIAFVEGLEGVEFSREWRNVGSELSAEYNGVKSRLFEMSCLGKLLSTPAPNNQPEPVSPPKMGNRFDIVTVDEANKLHLEGREFAIHIGTFGEYGDALIIEYTDLWRREQNELTDDELPF